jgi:hypothetical protein
MVWMDSDTAFFAKPKPQRKIEDRRLRVAERSTLPFRLTKSPTRRTSDGWASLLQVEPPPSSQRCEEASADKNKRRRFRHLTAELQIVNCEIPVLTTIVR